jgi:hypothetical protein
LTSGDLPPLDPRTNRFAPGYSYNMAGVGYPHQQNRQLVPSPDSGAYYSGNMLPRGSSWSSHGGGANGGGGGGLGDDSPPGMMDSPPHNGNPATTPKGYVYVIFESDRGVRTLLRACSYDFGKNNYYFRLFCRTKSRSKEVSEDDYLNF